MEQRNPQTPKDRTVYVTDIDQSVSESEINKLFQQYGQVIKIQVKSINQKKSLFVEFQDAATAQKVLEKSGSLSIQGRPIRVNKYLEMAHLDPQANVVIQDLPPGHSEPQLFALLQKYGNILSVKISLNNKPQKEIAYVQFETVESADRCIEDASSHKLKVSKHNPAKGKSSSEKTTLYIRDVEGPQENLNKELEDHLAKFGEYESVKVDFKQGKGFAFVKYRSSESAEALFKSDTPFRGNKLLVNYVISFNDSQLESNLFTKNIKSGVTEAQIEAVVSKVANVQGVQKMQVRRQDAYQTQMFCIYLASAEDGIRLMEKAFSNPDILDLYHNRLVKISPLMKQQDLKEFKEMKHNQMLYSYRQRQERAQFQQSLLPFYLAPAIPFQPYPPQFAQPGPFPGQAYPPQGPPYQAPGPYPPQGGPQGAYPPQQRGPRGPRGPNNYNNNRRQAPGGRGQHQGPYQPVAGGQANHQGGQPSNQSHRPRVQYSLEDYQRMKQNGKGEQVTQIIGLELMPKVKEIVKEDEKSTRVTGILLDFENFSVEEMFKMKTDAAYLNEQVQEVLEQLQE